MTIQTKSQLSFKPNTAISKQDKVSVLREISTLIQHAAKLYQIPNFDEVNALILSEWVYDEYQHRNIELVQDALRKPPVIRDTDGKVIQVWRLTPDVLKQWIDQRSLEREEEKQRKESAKRQEEDKWPEISAKTEMKIAYHLESLRKLVDEEKKSGIRTLPKLNGYEIKTEGDTRPKVKKSVIGRQGYTVPLEDENGNFLGNVENVLADSPEHARQILEALISSGNFRVDRPLKGLPENSTKPNNQ